MKRTTKGLFLLALFLPLSACTHSLNVKNMQKYKTNSTFSASNRPINILITPFGGNIDQQWFYDAVIEELSLRPYVGQIQSNSYQNKATASGVDFRPDCVLSIEPVVKFHGSGWNYLICFPGFLIFTHAWNGYVYRAVISTKITIYDSAGNTIDTMKIDTTYKFRHCDFGRGFWSASGWWMPGLGATSLVAGFFLIQYDDDATVELLPHIKKNYSTYVVEHLYKNANFEAIINSAEQEVAQEEKPPAENDFDGLELMLNKLRAMHSEGLISDAELKQLREKTILEY